METVRAAGVGGGAVAAAGNGKVPSASPTDMFSLDSRFRGNDGAVVVDGGDTDTTNVVVGTVAAVSNGVADAAAATVTVTNPDDATVATNGNAHKSSFPRTRESRTNNSAQPSEFNAAVVGTVATVDAATTTHP